MSISPEAIQNIESLVGDLVVKGIGMLASAAHASEEDAARIEERLQDALNSLDHSAQEEQTEHEALTESTEAAIAEGTAPTGSS